MGKSLLVTYILWLCGGALGLHHIYLGRDKHAFIWWATLGGWFGMGWLREMCHLSDYVDDANNEESFIQELTNRMRYRKKPSFSMTRFLGEVSIGMLFGFLVQTAVPEEWMTKGSPLNIVMTLVIPVAIAFGVYVVANIGREVGSFKVALVGAYLSLVFVKFMLKAPGETQQDSGNSLLYGALFAAIALNWKGKSWLRKPKSHRNICIRFITLLVCASLYTSLWTSGIYHNAYVTTKDGEPIKVREAVHNFFKSQAWLDTKSSMWQLYEYYQLHGFEKIWEEFVSRMDPEGEQNAYKVLGINSSSSQEEITGAYRKLAKQWHPDKQKDPSKKEEQEKKFMEIQKAYETLSTISKRRAEKNARRRSYDRASEF